MSTRNAGIALMVGGALLVVGSFLDWGTVLGVEGRSGIEGGDGWFTLTSGAVVLVLGYMSFGDKAYPRWFAWTALAVGAVVALINFWDIVRHELLDLAVGMWVMLAGILVAVFGLVVGHDRPDTTAP